MKIYFTSFVAQFVGRVWSKTYPLFLWIASDTDSTDCTDASRAIVHLVTLACVPRMGYCGGAGVHRVGVSTVVTVPSYIPTSAILAPAAHRRCDAGEPS